MDQPPQQSPPISVEGILAWFLGVIATLGAIVVRGKFRVKAMRERVELETAPSIQKENIEWSENLIAKWESEMQRMRDEVAAVRKEAREEIQRERERADMERKGREDMQERAMACESRVPFLEHQIEGLKLRVAELEKQIAGGATKS